MEIRLDTFIDAGLVRKVEGIVRDMMKEKGFQNAEVTHEIKEVPGGPKLVHLTFNIDEGPKVKIQTIELRRQQGDQQRHAQTADEGQQGADHLGASCSAAGARYQENKFDEDADKIVEYYRDRGYITARVGAPELDGGPRLAGQEDALRVELRIPVIEGNRYKVGEFDFAGNTVVKSDALRPMFKVEPGDVLQRESDSQGPREGARAVRRGRVLSSSPGIPTTSSGTSGSRRSRTPPRR